MYIYILYIYIYIIKGIRFLLCVIDIFTKYAWVVLIKDKKGTAVNSAFQKILDNSRRKPNKLWVEKGSEFKTDH